MAIAQSADRLAAILGEYADAGEPLDIWRQLGTLTLDVVGRTAFG